MKGIRVPKDVRKAIIKKYTIRLVCFAVIMTGFVLAIFLWENKIIDNLNTGYKIIIYTAWLAVPFLVTGVPLAFLGSSYYGECIKVEIQTLDAPKRARPTTFMIDFKWINIIYLHIRKPSGKVIRQKTFRGEAEKREFVDFYHEGDAVVHIKGTKFVQRLPRKAEERLNCVMCGGINGNGSKSCRFCGYSLKVFEGEAKDMLTDK